MSNSIGVTFNNNSSPGDAWSIEVDPMSGCTTEATLALEMIYSSDGGTTWNGPLPAGGVWSGGAVTTSGNYDGYTSEQYEGAHQLKGYFVRRQYHLHVVYTQLAPPNAQTVLDYTDFSTATQY